MNTIAAITRNDLDEDFYWAALATDRVAWDIETSGLDWHLDRIGTCQVAMRGMVNVVTLSERSTPKRLMSLLESSEVQKVFHHAPFDLRFMTHQWGALPQNIACTKVASKILSPHLAAEQHSLKPVLERHLGINISKAEQRSDWLAERLTSSQVEYAATDVAHLLDLVTVLESAIDSLDLTDHLLASWAYLPHRVHLDLRGSGDVFTY